MKITIKHISKIEGHASFFGELKKGNMAAAKMATLEGARLIEGVLVGRNYMDAPLVTSRICGVCPVVHNLTSIKALEKAMKVKVSESTIVLRKLMQYAQLIQSHALHVYFMSLPDFYGKDSGLDIVRIAPKEARQALEIRDFGNKLTEVIGGRAVHPINSQVGGFLKLPSRERLHKSLKQTNELLDKALNLAHLISHKKFVDFERKTEYVSLSHGKEYAIYDGFVKSMAGWISTSDKFEKEVEEIQEAWDLIKRTKIKGRIYMVGALARVNNNWKQLNPIARAAFLHMKFKMPIYNSFYNIFCQSIEIIHCLEECQKLLKKYLGLKNVKLMVRYKVRAGKGCGAIEAPRGTLFHYYEMDKYGILKNVNIVTPTAQFINNLEADLSQFIGHKKFTKKDYYKIGMMIRAYDPCMTCATH